MTEKRFINDIDYGQLIDTKGELSTIDYSDKVDFYELWEFLNKLADENEQLKHDATVLIQANQDYRRENEELKKQLNYIQNSISEHIKHQKTELGQKALKEIIEDYNEWLLGHKELI